MEHANSVRKPNTIGLVVQSRNNYVLIFDVFQSVWILCSKTEHSVPFGLMDLPFLYKKFCPKTELFYLDLDAVQIPNRLELGQKLNLQEPNMFGFLTLTVLCIQVHNYIKTFHRLRVTDIGLKIIEEALILNKK